MKNRTVQFILGAARYNQLVDDGRPEVVFLGRSNVGKSSLINMLAGRKGLARTSGTPGKTREFNFYLVDETFYLVDVPGLGYSRVGKADRFRWVKMIGRYLRERETLRGVFHLIDSRHPPTRLDQEVMTLVRELGVPYFVVLTKADKLSGNGRARADAAAREVLTGQGLEAPLLMSSSAKGWARVEIWEWIEQLTGDRANLQ